MCKKEAKLMLTDTESTELMGKRAAKYSQIKELKN